MAFFQPNYCKIYHRRVRLLFGVEETVCITNLLFPHSFVLLLSIVLRQLCLSTPQLKPRVHSSLHVLGMGFLFMPLYAIKVLVTHCTCYP